MKPHRSLFFSLSLFVLLLPSWSFADRELATIIRAVDGDTLEVSLDGHSEKVRLIGVDTPEVHESEKLHRDSARTHQDEATIKALGQRAWDFTKSLVHAGDQVQLEYGQEPRDKYHRVLAFVWLPDGRMLNETIICEGFSNAYTRYPFNPEYMERFRACERQAREQGKGLWAAEGMRETHIAKPTSQVSTTISDVIRGNKRSKIYHLPNCPDYSHISMSNVVTFRTERDALVAGYRKAKNCK